MDTSNKNQMRNNPGSIIIDCILRVKVDYGSIFSNKDCYQLDRFLDRISENQFQFDENFIVSDTMKSFNPFNSNNFYVKKGEGKKLISFIKNEIPHLSYECKIALENIVIPKIEELIKINTTK